MLKHNIMKTTRTVWTLLIAGSALFASCQNNNRPVAQNTDTTGYSNTGGSFSSANSASNNSTIATDTVSNNAAGGTAFNSSNTSDNTGTTGTESSSSYTGKKSGSSYSSNACVAVPRRHVYHKASYAYKRHRKHKSTGKTTIETQEQENVATVEPPTPEPAVEAPTTGTATISYEQPQVYTGSMPVTKKRAMVHLAPEVGGNLNNLYKLADDYQTSNQLKVGFNAGVMVNVELGSRLSLEPGLRYIMKGGEITRTSNIGLTTMEHKEKLTFHYIELPLNLVYNSGDWGTNRFMIGAGPYISYLANAQDKTKDVLTAPEGTTVSQGQHQLQVGDPNKGQNIRNYDAGADAFIGYQMKGGVYVKAGAEVGLLDLQKHSNTIGQSGFYDRNYNFLLTVGYMCGYNKK
jgi:hypothetical protein